MRVSELIEGSLWLPGFEYSNTAKKPKITIILPTFRRAASGLLTRAIESALSQTIEDIELIVIDDASTDGSFEIIQNFQKRDGRVSCIRHKENIGLPAVSSFEGLSRARADKVTFLFDDCTFYENAVDEMLKYSEKYPNALIYGKVDFSHIQKINGKETVSTYEFGQPFNKSDLLSSNTIPNLGVLLPKHLVDEVGYYDPHILMTRLCDWDLWCRISRRFEVEFLDRVLGREDGIVQNDSLGNTYEMNQFAVSEHMSGSRNEKLKPENFLNYDVFAVPSETSFNVALFANKIANNHAEIRGWEESHFSNTHDDFGHIIVLTHELSASTVLYFDFLPEHSRKRIRILSTRSGWHPSELLGASALIVVRHPHLFPNWISFAKQINIATYLFLDDNLTLIHEETHQKELEEFAIGSLLKTLEVFDEILVSSKNLKEYYSNIAPKIKIGIIPVSAENIPTRSIEGIKSEVFTFSTFGGTHRLRGFQLYVLPALNKLSNEGFKVRLVIARNNKSEVPSFSVSKNIIFETYERNLDYVYALNRLMDKKIDVLIHPPSDSSNNKFKTMHPLLAANYLGAALVLPKHEPYMSLAEEANPPAIIIDNWQSTDAWYDLFKKLITKEIPLEGLLDSNRKFVHGEFSGKETVDFIEKITHSRGIFERPNAQFNRLLDLYKKIDSATRTVFLREACGLVVSAVLRGVKDIITRNALYKKVTSR